MIKKFDELQMTFEDAKKMSLDERKARAKERENLLSQMTNDELNELLERPYPSQFKQKIRSYIK